MKKINLSKTFKITSFSLVAFTVIAGNSLIMKEEDKNEQKEYSYASNDENDSSNEKKGKKDTFFLVTYFRLMTRMINNVKRKIGEFISGTDKRKMPILHLPQNTDLVIPPTLVLDLSAITSTILDRETKTPLKRPGLDLFLKKLSSRYEIILIDDSYTTDFGSTTIDKYSFFLFFLFFTKMIKKKEWILRELLVTDSLINIIKLLPI